MEEATPVEDGIVAAQLCELLDELKKRFLGFVQLPVEPADFAVLTVGVVVALLGVAQFISCQKHRHSLRKKQSSDQVALLFLAQAKNVRLVRWAFDIAVPAIVVVAAVAVFFTIGLVV